MWLNPPYGRTIGAWMAKAAEEVRDGRAELVVCLVPARVDTVWFRESEAAASLVRIWPGRIKFVGGRDSAPFPNAVVVFGELSGRHGTSHKTCVICDRVFFPPRMDAKTCSPAHRKALSRIMADIRDMDAKSLRKFQRENKRLMSRIRAASRDG